MVVSPGSRCCFGIGGTSALESSVAKQALTGLIESGSIQNLFLRISAQPAAECSLHSCMAGATLHI
jgi:hypothetical protein